MKIRNNKNLVFIFYVRFTLFFMTIALMIFGCGGSSDISQGNNSERLIPSVEAVQARDGTLPLTERLTGLVLAKNQVEIYPEISAAIAKAKGIDIPT